MIHNDSTIRDSFKKHPISTTFLFISSLAITVGVVAYISIKLAIDIIFLLGQQIYHRKFTSRPINDYIVTILSDP